MNESCLWIATPRPNHLVNALAAAVALRGRFGACGLLYEHSSWWDNARWERLMPVFERVVALRRVATCRGLRDLPRLERDLRERQEILSGLGVGGGDVFVCISSATGVSNSIASAYPDHVKIFCGTRKAYEDASRPADFRRYRFTTSSALEYFYLHPRLGLLRTLRLKPWLPTGGDGARLERPERAMEEIYQGLVLWSNEGAGAKIVPASGPSAAARVHPSPYPDLRHFAGELPAVEAVPGARKVRKRVLFFGTPFLLVRNLPPEQYVEVLNRCLDYLRRHYGDGCRLIYRPHPAETGEQAHLRLDGFETEADREVAELYFVKNFAEIEAVYTVSSTVSRVAFNYGLNAYAFWPCFPFGATAREYFRTLMDTVPAPFEVRSLEEGPISYRNGINRPAGDSFADVLARALDAAARSRMDSDRTEKAVATFARSPV